MTANNRPILPDHAIILERIKVLRKSLQVSNLKKSGKAAIDFLEWLKKTSTVLVDDWKGQYQRHGTVTPFVPRFLPGFPSGTLDMLSDLLIQLVQLGMATKPGFKDKALELSGEFLKLSGVSVKPSQRRRQGAARKQTLPPLSEREREVYDLIANLPLGNAMTGKEITRETGILQSTLTAHIIPKLKPHGIRNRPGAGYYKAT